MDNKDIFINSYIDMISRKYHQSDDVQKNRNLAFEIFSIAVLLDKPFDEVYDTIQIKGGDGGFDGIYFEQLEDTASYVQHVFQCKNINTLKKNELSKFQSDYRSVFSEGNSAGQLNIEGVLPSLDEYEEITASRCIIYPRLYFIFNGNKYDDKSANKALFDLFSKPNEFEIIDKNDLYERIAGNRRLPRKPVEFVFEAQKSSLSPREPQALYSYAIGNVRAANFRASATQICDLLKKENDTNGTDQYLFEENIRSFLNLRAKPNKKMKETLESSDAIYFPFFNNGITMVAERLEIPLNAQYGKYLVKILNPQIVNGLQTTKVLQSVYSSGAESLNGVDVNIRIYETNDKSLIEKITDATNTQSPINFKDKLSTSEFLKNLKMLFSNKGINLIVKRGEQFELRDGDEPRASVSSETVIKFWYATYFERPEIAKNSISSVLQQFYDGMNSRNEILSGYFSDMDKTPLYMQMFTAYRIYAVVQREKKIHAAEEFVKSSDELLCYGIFEEYKKSGKTECMDAQIDGWYARVFDNVKELMEKSKADYESDGRTFSYNNFLKNAVCRTKYDAAYGKGKNPAWT